MEILGIAPDGTLALIIISALKIGLLIAGFIILTPIGKKILASALQKAGSKQKITSQRVKTLEKLLVNVYSYVIIFLFIVMLFGI